MSHKLVLYLWMLAPVISIGVILISVTVARNAKARKAGEKRGLFE